MRANIIAPFLLGLVALASAAHAQPAETPPTPAVTEATAPAEPAPSSPAESSVQPTEAAPPGAVAPPEAAPPAKPKKPPYSLPWALRPAIAVTVVRAESSIAFQDAGITVANMLTGMYKVVPELSVVARVPYVYNAPEKSSQGHAIGNPLVGALYTPVIAKGFRLPVFAALALPFGMGGGDDRNMDHYLAAGSGIYARSAMDNALFAVNYMTPVVGAGLAYVDKGLTVQAEATLLYLMRVRGSNVEKDDFRTNSTYGLHVGYALLPELTVSGELRYQRWLSSPMAVQADSQKRDQLTAAIGVRTKLDITKSILTRPGISYAHPLDNPMDGAGYRILTVDVPVLF